MVVCFMHRVSTPNRLRLKGGGSFIRAPLPSPALPLLPCLAPSPTILLICLVGSVAACLLGVIFARSIVGYPGAEGSAYIFPSFCIAFGIVLAIFFFFRINYSRSLFLICFSLNLIVFYTLYFLAQRSNQLSVGVVPCGDT